MKMRKISLFSVLINFDEFNYYNDNYSLITIYLYGISQ